MDVAEVLDFDRGAVGELHEPVMLIGLEGWFDVGGSATAAVEAFVAADHSLVVGTIDPDPFYDFTQQRPHTVVEDGLREISWPTNEFVVQRNRDERDVVALIGIEPHLHWRTYVDATIDVARALGCEAVVTVGSNAEPIPHTRTPPVTGSTSNGDLARALGLVAPSYEGTTGVAGVLQTQLEAAGMPAVSLRVGVPHYLMNAEHPQSTSALVRHVSHVLGIASDLDLADQISTWRDVHDEIIDNDDQLAMYVRMLESEFDRRAEAAIPSADDIARDFQDFLDAQRDVDEN
ncbi:MAG: PAC2 family protein [Actinomycetota bacterium]